MTSARIPHTSLPGATTLFTNLLYDFERVEQFYFHRPSLEAIEPTLSAIDYPDERRTAVVEALRGQNHAAGAATQQNLDLFAQPGTVVVATGQQVGLFGGPVFALFKALTAAKYAATLRDRGIPAVAVFWLATEDHDLAEVDHAWLFDANGKPRLTEAKPQAADGAPVGGAKLPAGVTDMLREACAGTPQGEELVSRVEAAYSEGRTLGQSFRALFEDLLGEYGLIFLDPMDPQLRSVCGELIRKAVANGNDLLSAVTERGKQLEAAGYHQQVNVGPGTSLLFRLADGRRSAIRRSGDQYLCDGESLSSAELIEAIRREPDGYSPNALLRPVIQDYLLPTAVFVGGPAELAYLAQSAVIYKLLLGRMPVVMPRAGFTILDSRSQKLLARYELDVPGCLAPRDEIRQHIANRLTPPELQQAFDDEGAVVDAALGRIHSTLTDFDPSLGEAFSTSQRKIKFQLDKIRAKAARESLERNERSAGDAERLSNLIYPEKTLQERLYCALPFLAQYGDHLVPSIYEAVDPDCLDHQVLTI